MLLYRKTKKTVHIVVHLSIHSLKSPCTQVQTSFSIVHIQQHYLHLIETITVWFKAKIYEETGEILHNGLGTNKNLKESFGSYVWAGISEFFFICEPLFSGAVVLLPLSELSPPS